MADPNLRKVTILGHLHPRDYKGNVVKTSKYTFLTFLPKNLYVQFSKAANVYFFVIMCM